MSAVVRYLQQSALQLGQQPWRGGPRQRLPGDAVSDELLQLRGLSRVRPVRAVLAGLGAGGQPTGKAVLLDESFDLGVADLHAADVDLREDQQPWSLASRFVVDVGCVERIEPVASLGKGIVLLRIDQQQGQRGLVEEEPVDQPVVLLPGQVPEQGLAVHRCVGRQRQRQRPDVHAMGAVFHHVLIFDQPICQRGLADRAFAKQHHLGVHVTAHMFGRRRDAGACEAVDIDVGPCRADHESRTIGAEGN